MNGSLLALGFAPYVGRIIGVDPEPAMLVATRNAAALESKAITLIESKAEALRASLADSMS
jgi:ubiquinone/menaquinone biosynthesis C-methylase UbiE